MALPVSFSEVTASRKRRTNRPARVKRPPPQKRAPLKTGQVVRRGQAEAPAQRLLMSLDVMTDCIVLSRWGRGDSVQRRIISAEDACRLFSSNIVADRPGAGGGPQAGIAGRRADSARHELRPWDCVCGWIDADRAQHYVVRLASHRRKIRVKVAGKWQRLTCRLPDLLAEVVGSVLDGRFAWRDIARVASVFEPARGRPRGEPSPPAVVYCPPLPNVDGGGDPCMGSIKLDRAEWAGLSPLAVFEEAFLKTDFADHYLACSLRDDLVKTHRNIVHATRRAKGRVPREWLRPLGTYAEIFLGQRPTPVEALADAADAADRQDDDGPIGILTPEMARAMEGMSNREIRQYLGAADLGLDDAEGGQQ